MLRHEAKVVHREEPGITSRTAQTGSRLSRTRLIAATPTAERKLRRFSPNLISDMAPARETALDLPKKLVNEMNARYK